MIQFLKRRVEIGIGRVQLSAGGLYAELSPRLAIDANGEVSKAGFRAPLPAISWKNVFFRMGGIWNSCKIYWEAEKRVLIRRVQPKIALGIV